MKISDFQSQVCVCVASANLILCRLSKLGQKPRRNEITENLKAHTNGHGIHAVNVFVDKPFIKKKSGGNRFLWKSGELFTCYHDWLFHKMEEVIFDCNSGGRPHQHCMDIMIAENV